MAITRDALKKKKTFLTSPYARSTRHTITRKNSYKLLHLFLVGIEAGGIKIRFRYYYAMKCISLWKWVCPHSLQLDSEESHSHDTAGLVIKIINRYIKPTDFVLNMFNIVCVKYLYCIHTYIHTYMHACIHTSSYLLLGVCWLTA